jgi:hypothetical protein
VLELETEGVTAGTALLLEELCWTPFRADGEREAPPVFPLVFACNTSMSGAFASENWASKSEMGARSSYRTGRCRSREAMMPKRIPLLPISMMASGEWTPAERREEEDDPWREVEEEVGLLETALAAAEGEKKPLKASKHPADGGMIFMVSVVGLE